MKGRTVRWGMCVAAVGLALQAGPAPRPAAAQPQGADTSAYVGEAYDPARDPAADLARAVERAQREGKRILLEVGGAWCAWCHALDRYLRTHADVAEALRRHFVVVKVNVSEANENAAFLSRYPPVPGYPHFFVLDGDGTFLHAQSTAALEAGDTYSDDAFLAFIARWGGS